MVEHGTENAGVDSSSLSLGTFPVIRPQCVANFPFLITICAHFAAHSFNYPSFIALAKALAASFGQPGLIIGANFMP